MTDGGMLLTHKAVDSTKGEDLSTAQLVRWGENCTPAGNRKGLVESLLDKINPSGVKISS